MVNIRWFNGITISMYENWSKFSCAPSRDFLKISKSIYFGDSSHAATVSRIGNPNIPIVAEIIGIPKVLNSFGTFHDPGSPNVNASFNVRA
ncbi:hypothetical protein BB558_000845 [Smittium angustum]|uniref:Uncharacterized protein n=1 Tax=Smittium angustum TaxID=133377 RepID=A0A2U1JDA9_SMIAN|nr:hypothetical protein BB558_000845 [Smittium angustum]